MGRKISSLSRLNLGEPLTSMLKDYCEATRMPAVEAVREALDGYIKEQTTGNALIGARYREARRRRLGMNVKSLKGEGDGDASG